MIPLSRLLLAAASLIAMPVPASAHEGRAGGKLVLTDGVTAIEGAAGGGLASWAVIAGSETKDGIGGSATATLVALPDFSLTGVGAAIGLFDRIELSYARHRFDTRAAGATLGLGRNYVFHQDIVGAKLKLAGDAVWDQDRVLPQIAVGVQLKVADRGAVIGAIGGKARRGADLYVSATKIVLARSLVLDATVRFTNANQFGLLGFGGDRQPGRTAQVEGSAALLLSPRLALGAEYRTRPNNLGVAREQDTYDLFGAWAFHRHLTLTAAYVDLGEIATVKRQRGLFVSLKAGM